MKINHILNPIDFSESSLAAMDYAKSLAQKYDSAITLLYVIDEMSRTQGWYVPHISIEEFYKEHEEQAKKKLEHCCYEELRNIKNVDRVIVKGDPSEEIVKYANSKGVDLIIMGAYSKSGMDFIFGSTTRKVLKKSKCPVLCVKVPPEGQ
jgi:nucleotide-binding universal stress UspA family protein